MKEVSFFIRVYFYYKQFLDKYNTEQKVQMKDILSFMADNSQLKWVSNCYAALSLLQANSGWPKRGSIYNKYMHTKNST